MTDEEREQIFLQWQCQHRGILLKVARSFAVSQGDQEDLLQEILIRLWQSIDGFEGQAKPSTWIYRVALNTAMAWQRGEHRRRRRMEKVVAMDAYWLQKKDPINERLALLYEAIHRLLPHERYLILLYLDNLQYSEIAEIIGISESNVGVRINRVRKKLTALCEKETAMLRTGIVFNIVVGGFVAYGISSLGNRCVRKQRRKVDRELEALGFPVPEEKTPIKRKIGRIMLALFALAACGYLLMANLAGERRADRPVQPAPPFDQMGSFGERETRQIEEWLAEFRLAGDYPGLMVAIVGEGRVLYQGAVGFADLKSRREASPETLWHVASVTKVFTSTLAAKLHAESVIDLDRPVRDHLPEGVSISNDPKRGAAITMRQLAAHTSGLPRTQPDDVQSAEGRYALEPKRLHEQLGEVDLLFDPGSDEEYSNLGLGLLGHALERAAGVPFEQLLKEEILVPLGMVQSGISLADEHRDLLATGYGRRSPREFKTHLYRSRLAPSGGMITSVAELSKFLLAQMPEPTQPEGLLSEPMLANLHTPVKLNDGSETDHALGWSVEERDSIGRFLEKNGGRSNASAWIGFSPDARVGVAVMANCGGAAVESVGFWLLERSVPNADPSKFDRAPRCAAVAPFTGVRWESDRPIVQVRGEWMKLVSIDGISVDQLLRTARQRFGTLARKRFTEDLVQVLAAAGHQPGWKVTLVLDPGDGKEFVRYEEEMTEEKRETARDSR